NLTLTVPVEADALQTLKELVMRDIGLTILPIASVYKEISRGELSAAPISQPDRTRELVLARPLGQPWSRATKLFADMLQAEIRQMVASNDRDEGATFALT